MKAVGKLEDLKRKTLEVSSRSTAGIGHTRWATHGRVSEENAHPLTAGESGDVAIVLNGIIENYAEIKRELIADGERFSSETDAEVVAHLVKRHYTGDLVAAVSAAYAQLAGHFAFVVAHRDHPDQLVGTRHQCPLIAGIGDGETFLASSITAFSDATRRVVYLEDGEIVAATGDSIRVRGADGRMSERDGVLVSWDDEIASKRGYESFMLKEIHEQPHAVGETIRRNLCDGALGLERVGDLDLADVRRVLILACGTAYHAGLVGSYLFEEWAGVPCDVEVASEWRYRRPLIEAGTLVVGISQSGETADTLAGLRQARQCGAPTVAVTNSPGSQITREVDAVLYTHAGIEIGVAATKTFTAQVTLLILFALRLTELRGTLGEIERQALMIELRSLPQKIISTLERHADVVGIAERHADKPYFFYVGRHVGLPVCLEGALKLKEISYTPTEALRRGRDEARADRAARRPVAGRVRRHRQPRRREARVEPAGDPRPRRAGGRDRDGGIRGARRARRRHPLGPEHQPAAAAGAGRDPTPVARLPHRPTTRPRRRPAAQPRQDGDRRVTHASFRSFLVCALLASSRSSRSSASVASRFR